MTQIISEESHRILLFLTKKLPSMIAYWDANLLCHYANDAYRVWFGADPDKLIGTSLRDLLGPDLFARNEPYVLGALRGELQTFERTILGADGVQRHSVALYVPDIEDGEVKGFVVQVTEINKLKKLEQALQQEVRLREQVEAHAQSLAIALKERSELLEVLAHEVRQPLNNASAALQSAQSVFVEAEQRPLAERLGRAQAVLQQVRGSIDNTLAVTALLAGGAAIQRADTDVDLMLQMAIGDLAAADRSRIHIVRQTQTRTVAIDIGLMRLALRNLLSNALRHGGGSAPVVVRVSDSDAPLALCIDIEDAGDGFAPEVLPFMFTRGAGGKGRKGGQGLGLYIVRRVMELHGGGAALLQNSATGATMRIFITQHEDD